MSAVVEDELGMETDEHGLQDATDPVAFVEARVREILEAGEPLSALSVERIFGAPRAQLESQPTPTRQPRAAPADHASFLRALRSRASRTDRQLFVSSDERGIFFPEPSHEIDAALGAALAQCAAETAERHGITLLIEERPVRGRMPEIETPIGCVRLVLGRVALYREQLVLDGRSWPYDREGRRAQVRPLRLGEQTLGAHEGEGLHGYLRLFVHPFLHQGELSLVRAADGQQLLERLCSQVLARPDEASNSERLQAALAAVEMIAPIAGVIERTLPDRLATLDTRRETIDQSLADTQARVIELLAQRRSLDDERQAALVEQAALGQETVMRALRESIRIAQLQPVRSVRVVADGNRPLLRVQLHPVVIEHRSRHHLCRTLVFTVPLTDPSPSTVRWERSGESASPHPHVAPGDHHTCWGEAQAHLAAALGRGELAAAVIVIAGWARLYNHQSPYNEISNFPTTTLQPGFHPEVDA
jgi:hypothetical protein